MGQQNIPVWGLWMMFLASVIGSYLLGKQLLRGLL